MLFRSVPSKSFGELVESKRHTPSLSAQEVKQLIDNKEDVVVVDVRRFDEYNTMSIPTGISVPGAELVLRLPELAPNPKTKVIVNCAGRTRSIIGTQSLINAGIPNEVNALRARGDLSIDLPAMRCVGYRQAWEALDGNLPMAELRDRGVFATRQLAKRQLTWLRSMPLRHVLQADGPDVLARARHWVDAQLG